MFFITVFLSFYVKMTERVIALIDMDCFYCQVETRLNPSLKGKPVAVVQYNAWKGGGIIAVNYEAREFGVTRHIRGDEARKLCPEIALVQVPELRGKADLTKYRDAGREVVNVLTQLSDCVERASVDEAYIDLTQAVAQYIKNIDTGIVPEQLPSTFVVGFSDESNNNEDQRLQGLRSWLANQMIDPNDLRLAVGGVIVEQIRAAIFKQTEFRCSAGVAHNKVLGKLVCGMHKPNQQTILPQSGLEELFRTLPVKKVRNLGGKLGDVVMEKLGCKVMADLLNYTEAQLQQHFDVKTGSWLYNIARGIDHEGVTPRLLSKSIGCCKKFPGKQALVTKESVEKWLFDLAVEMSDRVVKDLEENKRRAKLLVVSFLLEDASSTRSTQFNSYDPHRIVEEALDLIKRSNGDKWSIPIRYLGLSAGKFVEEASNQNSIQHFFKSVSKLQAIDTHKEIISAEESLAHKEEIPTSGHKVIVNRSNCKENKKSVSFFAKYLKSVPDSKQQKVPFEGESRPGTSADTRTHDIDNEDSVDDYDNSSRLSHSKPTKKSSVVTISEECSDSSEEMLISPGEIFPDLKNVDDSVAALLPASMRKKLHARQKENRGQRRVSSSAGQKQGSDTSFEKSTLNFDLNVNNSEHIPNSTSGERVIHKSDSDVEETDGCDYRDKLCYRNTRNKSHEQNISSPHELNSNSRNVPDSDSTDVDDDVDSDDGRTRLLKNFNAVIDNDSSSDLKEANIPQSAGSDIPGQRCDRCSKHIPLVNYFEHLDFHAAEELDKQLNSGGVTATNTNNNSLVVAQAKKSPAKSGTRTKKRGRPSKSSTSTSDKKMRSITSFFTRTT